MKDFQTFRTYLCQKSKNKANFEYFNSVTDWDGVFWAIKTSIDYFLESGVIDKNILLDFVPKSILLEQGFIIDEIHDELVSKDIFLLMNSRIKLLRGESIINYMIDSKIENVVDSTIKIMSGMSSIILLNGTSIVKYMLQESRIETMQNYSIVYFLTSSATVGVMQESSVIMEVSHFGKVELVKDSAKIINLIETKNISIGGFYVSEDDKENFFSDNFSILNEINFQK